MAPAQRTADATDALRASLVGHALRIVRRDGAKALTMRTLAAEAECALGLPYKVFGSRDELVGTLVGEQLRHLAAALDEFVAAAGSGTIAQNLIRFADLFLGADTQVIKLADIHQEPELIGHLRNLARSNGDVDRVATAVTRYLAAEKELGRLDESVDEDAVGFLVTGAIHNLMVSGDGYPRPDRGELTRFLISFARLLEARGG